MKLDKQALERLLALSDDQFMQVVEKLAAESGINLSAMNIGKGDLARLRAALRGADDEDVERMKRQFGQFGKNGRNPAGGDPANGGTD